ncbi:MAG: peptidase S41, partial [Rhodanobacter sp.]
MRSTFRIPFARLLVTPLMLALPVSHAQDVPAGSASVAAPIDLPASSSSASVPSAVDLDDIRNFSRVYEVVRQAYVEKVDDKTLMKAAITGMLAGLDPHSEYLDKEGLTQLNEDTTGEYS